MGVPATSGILRTNVLNMEIGDYISCKYVAASGVAGVFSELGTASGAEIPVLGTATPNGIFYFIKADRNLLIADRVIQTSIMWDTLNNSKFIEGYPQFDGIIRSLSGGVTFLDLNEIPTLTSDTSTGLAFGTPLAVAGSYNYWQAFDKNINTYAYIGPDTNNSVYLGYKFINKKLIDSYKLNSIYVSAADDRSPKSWIFQGSQDNITWDNLDSQTNISWILNASNITHTQTFNFENNTAYQYYRLNVLDFWKSNKVIGIPSFEMYCSKSQGSISTTSRGFGAYPKTNEWDKYIVNSDLKGTIIKGDDNVWHYKNGANNICSWVQDSGIIGIDYGQGAHIATYRLMRPNPSLAINTMYSYAFNNPAGAIGFRPVLQLQHSKQNNVWY